MAFAKNSMIFFMVILVGLSGLCFGTDYKVGDSSGWTNNNSSVNYKDWAASKKFIVGDTIVFEYNGQMHNVLQVTRKHFKECNATDPKSITNSGNDRLEMKEAGHFFYICGVPGHCEAGQKVDIRVLDPSQGPSPSPSQSQSPRASPYARSPASVPTTPGSPKAPISPPNNNGAPAIQFSSALPVMLAGMALWALL